MNNPSVAPNLRDHVRRDPRWALVQRIADSPQFRASARLREFLFYIADCMIRNAPEEATEQQIGLHVFRRSAGYNSSEDSIVRTHARLMRQKLAAYFAEEGRDEAVVVEVPKGHYLPVFIPRAEHAPLPAAPVLLPNPPVLVVADAQPKDPPETAPVVQPRTAARQPFVILVILALGVCAALIAYQFLHRTSTTSAVDRLWKPFFNDDPPLIVFSNALFVGDSKRGLSYASQAAADSASTRPVDLVDTYTGIGELSAVYTLTRLFDEHHAHFVLKRSRLMTWDEAKLKDLIFIGSTAENPSLNALQSVREFTITATPDAAGIVNRHPRSGEPAVYSRPEHPLSKDYAIIALLPGMQPGRRILVFSGLTTFGTQAAVEFACHPETANDLVRQVTGSKGDIRSFEAVIETTITGGVPVQAHLVTVHIH